jgi:hypothetical protein
LRASRLSGKNYLDKMHLPQRRKERKVNARSPHSILNSKF